MDEGVVAGAQEDGDTGVELQPIEHQSPAETIQRLAEASDSETAKQCLHQLSAMLDSPELVKEGVIQQAKVIRAANAAKARIGDSWAEEEYRALLYKFADSADTAEAAAAVEDQRAREERQEEERKQQAAEQSSRRVQEQKERGRKKRSCCLSCCTNCLFFGVLFSSGTRPHFLRASCRCDDSS